MMRSILISILVGLSFTLLSACTKKDSQKKSDTLGSPSSESSYEEAIRKETPSKNVQIRLGTFPDQNRFDMSLVRVPVDSNVTLTLQNNLSYAVNWILVRAGSEEEILKAAKQAGVEKDYIPEDDRILAKARLIPAGQSGEIRFKAPKEAGEFPFLSTAPDQGSMRGVLKLVN